MRLAYAVTLSDTKSPDILAWRGQFPHMLDVLRDLGYRGIEIMVRDPSLLDSGLIRRETGDRGLEVAAVGTGPVFSEDKLWFTHPDPSVRHAAVDRARDVAAFASSLSAPMIVGKLRGFYARDMERETTRRLARDSFLRLLEATEPYNTLILVEAQSKTATDFLCSAHETTAWVSAIGHPRLGLMLDTYHMNIEDPSIPAGLVMAGRHLGHVHLADINRLVPGSGHIDFHEVIHVLKALDYRGYLSMEILQAPDPVTAARRAAVYITHLLSGLEDPNQA